MKKIKITLEADDWPEPVVFEREVLDWRWVHNNQIREIVQDSGHSKEYEIIGGSIRIEWRLPA